MRALQVLVLASVRRGAALALAAGALACPPAAAAQDADGSAADRLGIPHAGGDLTSYALTRADGRIFFAFDFLPLTGPGYAPGCEGPANRSYLGLRRADGRLVSLGRSAGLQAPPVQTDGRVAILAGRRNCATQSAQRVNIVPRQHLHLLRGPFGRRPSSDVALSSGAEAFDTTAVARHGRLAVAWLEPKGNPTGSGSLPRERLHLSVGRIDGRMSRPRVVSGTHTVGSARLAWTSDGELLVVYVSRGRILLRTWAPGRSLSPRSTVATTRPGDFALSLAVGPQGRALLAWGYQANMTAPDPGRVVSAAVRTRPGGRFSAPHRLDRTDSSDREATGPLSVRLGADGIGTVSWQLRRDHGPLRVETVVAAGAFQPPQVLALDVGQFGVMVGRPDGGDVVQWTTADALQQSIRPAGSLLFGPPERAASRADLVEWITGQVIASDGGWSTAG